MTRQDGNPGAPPFDPLDFRNIRVVAEGKTPEEIDAEARAWAAEVLGRAVTDALDLTPADWAELGAIMGCRHADKLKLHSAVLRVLQPEATHGEIARRLERAAEQLHQLVDAATKGAISEQEFAEKYPDDPHITAARPTTRHALLVLHAFADLTRQEAKVLRDVLESIRARGPIQLGGEIHSLSRKPQRGDPAAARWDVEISYYTLLRESVDPREHGPEPSGIPRDPGTRQLDDSDLETLDRFRVPANMVKAMERTPEVLGRQLRLWGQDEGRDELMKIVPEYTGFNLSVDGLAAWCAVMENLDGTDNENPQRTRKPNVLVLRDKRALYRAAGYKRSRADKIEAGLNEMEQASEWVTRRPIVNDARDGEPVYEWVRSKAPLLRLYQLTRTTEREFRENVHNAEDLTPWRGAWVFVLEPILFDALRRFHTWIPRRLPELVRSLASGGERINYVTRHRLWGCIWVCQQATGLARRAAPHEFKRTRDYEEAAQELHVWSKRKAKRNPKRIRQGVEEALETAKAIGLLRSFQLDARDKASAPRLIEMEFNPSAFPHLNIPRKGRERQRRARR